MANVSTDAHSGEHVPVEPPPDGLPRIDNAHSAGPSIHHADANAGPVSSDEELIDWCGETLRALGMEDSQPLAHQAHQLAEILQRRQQDLDQREAKLNAQAAKFDEQQRFARLCDQQQDGELTKREARLNEREQAFHQQQERWQEEQSERERGWAEQQETLAAQVERLQSQQLAVANEKKALAKQRAAILVAQTEMQQRRSEQIKQLQFEQQQTQLKVVNLRRLQRQLESQQKKHEQNLDAKRQRRNLLPPAEVALSTPTIDALNEHRRSLIECEQRLQNERASFDAWREAERQRLEETERRLQLRQEKHQSQCQRRRLELDQLHRSIEETRRQVSDMHAETLETRLAIQQLWSQVAADRSPSEITKALAEIRLQIARHYQQEQQQLHGKREHLRELGKSLAEKARQLAAKRAELNRWDHERQSQLEHEAARLIAREQELRLEEEAHERRQADWQKERLELQQQIREALMRLEQAKIPTTGVFTSAT